MPYPSKYDEAYCEQLVAHMSKGYSFESFAGVISVTKRRLYEWEEKHPEFAEAKEIAFAKCQLHWETQAIDGTWNHPEQSTLNVGVWVFNMKNRFGWRDAHKLEVDGKLTLEQLVLGSYGDNKNNDKR